MGGLGPGQKASSTTINPADHPALIVPSRRSNEQIQRFMLG
jgi:hypothetical protein